MKMSFKKYGLIFLGLVLSFFVFGQNEKEIDSLLSILEKNPTVEEKIDVFIRIAMLYQNTDSLQTFYHANKAAELASATDDLESVLLSSYPKGVVMLRKGHYRESEGMFKEMIDLSVTNKHLKPLALGNYGLGWLNGVRGQYDDAQQYLLKTIEVNKVLGNNEKLSALAFNILGIVSDNKGNTIAAIDYYFKALEINKKLGRKASMASCFNNISIIYKNQDNYSKAIYYSTKAFDIYKELKSNIGMAKSLSTIGDLYFSQGDYNKALEFQQKSLDLKNVIQERREIAKSYISIGKSLSKKERYAAALDYLEDSFNIFDSLGIDADRADALVSMGEVFLKQNKLTKAKNYLNRGIKIAKDGKLLGTVRDGSKLLAETEKALQNFELAYDAQVKFKELSDSIINKNTIDKIIRLEAAYDLKRAKDSIDYAQKQEVAKLKNDAKKRENQKQLIYLIICLILTTIVVLYIYLIRNRQKRRLQILRDQISKDLHDEIGSTLSSISLLGLVASKSIEKDPEKARTLLDMIDSNATRSIESMNDIVWAIKSDNDPVIDIANRMRAYASEFEETGEWEFDIILDDEISNKSLDMMSRRNIFLIYKEAVNNAVKYSNGDKIIVNIQPRYKNSISIDIIDNGDGFVLDNINSNINSLSGNGLNNMKKRAIELGGELEIHSIQGKGTTISLFFMLRNAKKSLKSMITKS